MSRCEHRTFLSGECLMGCKGLCERGNEKPRTLDYGEYLAQMRNADAMRVQMHNKLIAEGYEWDGMDGYHKHEA